MIRTQPTTCDIWSSVGATALYVATGFLNATTLQMVLLCAPARMFVSTRTSATDTLSHRICWEVNSTTPVSSSSSYCRPFTTEYVCGRASSQGYHIRLDIARNQEYYTPCSYWGPAALLEPTAPGRAGYYCGGSTFPHASDGFHVSYAGETCVDIKVNVANLSSRSLLELSVPPSSVPWATDYQACVKGNL
jgi:hypothetical protein